jgi:HSP20 family molecular chaperone IbpA
MSKSKTKAITDTKGSVLQSLSTAGNLIETAQNAVQSSYVTGTFTPGWSTTSTANNYTVGGTALYQQIDCNGLQWNNGVYSSVYDNNIYPKIDIEIIKWIEETEHTSKEHRKYIVKIYLAGVDKKRIHLNLEESGFIGTTFYKPKINIVIDSDKKPFNGIDGQVPQAPPEWFLKESKQSFTSRIQELPDDADVLNATEAKLINGILEFEIPKLNEPPTPTQIKNIKIK